MMYPELQEQPSNPALTEADNALAKAMIGAMLEKRLIGGTSDITAPWFKNLTDAVTARLTDQGYDVYLSEDVTAYTQYHKP
jgi:DNA-binding LacI/PurR family transcriptional regulator